MKPTLHRVYVVGVGHPDSRPLPTTPRHSPWVCQAPGPSWLLSWFALPPALFFLLPHPPTSKMENLENQTWATGGKQPNLVICFDLPASFLEGRDAVPFCHQQ